MLTDINLAENNCFGGVARLSTAVEQERGKNPDAIFLNAGDFYQGNILYTYFKWRIVAHFANLLNFTAMVSLVKKITKPP